MGCIFIVSEIDAIVGARIVESRGIGVDTGNRVGILMVESGSFIVGVT